MTAKRFRKNKRRFRKKKEQYSRRLRTNINTRNTNLASFLSPYGHSFVRGNNRSALADCAIERPACPDCGATDRVIKRGYRDTKYRGRIQRYNCSVCKKRFVYTPYIRMRYPEWVIDAVLSLKAKGLRDSQIAEAVSEEAKRRKENVQLSPKNINNIVRRALGIALEFERYAPRKEKAATWIIDDTPQPRSKKKTPCENSTDNNNDSKDYWFWITSILEEEDRYCLSGVSSDNRNYVNSEVATRLALQRAKYGPQLVKCDGYRGHPKGVRKVLRHVEIIAKSKKEDYAWINPIERYHQTMRSLAIKKRRHFRALESLAILVDLVRIYYNFLRSHRRLGGIPPAKKAGIDYPYHEGLTWSEFIRFAFNFLRKRRRPT